MNLTIYDVTAEYLNELSNWNVGIPPKIKMVKRLKNNFDSLILRSDIRRGPIRNMEFATMMMTGLEEFYNHVISATEKVALQDRQEMVIEVIAEYPFPELELIKNLALVLIEVWKTTLIEMTPRNMNASLAATIAFVKSGVDIALLNMPRVGRFDINVGQGLTATIAMAIIWRAIMMAMEQKQNGEL